MRTHRWPYGPCLVKRKKTKAERKKSKFVDKDVQGNEMFKKKFERSIKKDF